jgi:hypothetical protein
MRYRSSSTGISVRLTPELVFDFILEKAFVPIGIHTTGRSREIAENRGRSIKLKHISQKKLVMPGTITCFVVTALWHRGKDSITPMLIKKIHDRLGADEFAEVVKNLDKMPVWMRRVFLQYQNMGPDDPQLDDWYSYYQG